MDACKHNESHTVHCAVNFMEDSGKFSVEVRLLCKCGRPFQFIGLPLGLDLNGAAMSVDGQTAIIAAAPVGTIPQPLDGALVSGFRVKTGKEH